MVQTSLVSRDVSNNDNGKPHQNRGIKVSLRNLLTQ